MNQQNILLLYLIIFFLSCSCEQEASTRSTEKNDLKKTHKKTFSKVNSQTSGIDFTNTLIDDPTDPIKNVMSDVNYFIGAGVAIGDINNDQKPDVFFAGNEVDNKLFLNKGDFNFEDISDKAGINEGKHWATGVTMADVNGDGWLDIYVSQSSHFKERASLRKNLLYINNKDLSFTERAEEFGLADDRLGRHASFFDYDKDGDLDCFVLNSSIYVQIPLGKVMQHLDQNKENLINASCHFYRNDNNKFTNVTEAKNMLKYGFGLGLVTADLNEDGWTDIYVANDYSVPDFMYINDGKGSFKESIKRKTKQISFYGMGADVGDLNNDGLPEICVVDMAANDHFRDKTLMASMSTEAFKTYVDRLKYQYQYMFNTVQLNNGNGTYSNIANLCGLSRTDWSWAILLADFNNDAYKDVFVSNGFKRYTRDNDSRIRLEKVRNENGGSVPMAKRKELYDQMPSIKMSNLIYENDKNLGFENKSNEWGLDHPSFSNGASYADLDGDGDLDLIVNNIDEEAFVYKNNSENNYLVFSFEDKNNYLNTKVYLKHNDKVQMQELTATRGYFSSVENRKLHFGLGSTDIVESIEIIWQDNKKQVLKNVSSNQTLSIKKKDAKSIHSYQAKNNEPLLKEISKDENLLARHRHFENEFDDFEKEVLLPHKQSSIGPALAIGDINQDGLEDVFIGGAKGKTGQIYLQNKAKKFIEKDIAAITNDKLTENADAQFIDIDGDKDLDLYVANGGGGDFSESREHLQDNIYLNDGHGNFKSAKNMVTWNTSASCIAATDFDLDGDVDLFVGGKSIPGKYPYADKSIILKNNGGVLTDVETENIIDLSKLGLVTDATWADLNDDKRPDLIVVGEWMSIKIFINLENGFVDKSEEYGVSDLKGWWYSVKAEDLNNDGTIDLVVGNVGKNIKFEASDDKPLKLFANDFDQNGSCDIVLSKKYKGKDVPTRGRQCSSDQMPFIKNKFPTYASFANASLDDILGDKLDSALKLETNTFESIVLINDGSKFNKISLPSLAQISPINDLVIKDVNGDNFKDLIIIGNNYDTEVETPRYDAGNGLVLINQKAGIFKPMKLEKSGFFAPHNSRKIALTKQNQIIIVNNNYYSQVFEFTK